MRATLAVSLASLVTALFACGEAPKGAAPLSPAASEARSPELAAALARVGDVRAFAPTPAAAYRAIGCERGEVDGLDVLVCHYADAAQAEAATTSARDFAEGALSGLVRQAGADLIAVADRKKVDPKGVRISKLVKDFTAAR